MFRQKYSKDALVRVEDVVKILSPLVSEDESVVRDAIKEEMRLLFTGKSNISEDEGKEIAKRIHAEYMVAMYQWIPDRDGTMPTFEMWLDKEAE
jgi:hypothetical protein